MPQRGELRSAEGKEAARLSAPVPPGRSAPPPFARTTPSPFLFRPLPPLPAVAWLRPACAAVRPTVTSPGPAPYHKYWRCRHRLSTLWLFPRLQCFHFFCLLCLFSSFLALLVCGVTRPNPLPTQPSPFLLYLRCSISLFRPPPPLLHSWCRCRAFPPTSSLQLMAQAALGISAQGNHIPL